jgi:hypothetical protein
VSDEAIAGETREAAAVPSPSEAPRVTEQLVTLRNLRAEIQDLKAAMVAVRKGEIKREDQMPYVAKTVDDIAALMKQFSKQEEAVKEAGVPPGRRLPDDTVRHLRNLWEQMRTNPVLDKDSDLDTQSQLRHLDALERQIKRMVYLIGYLTIPSRLNDWLEVSRPGYYIPFHLVFEDEVPDQADRLKILQHLAFAPAALIEKPQKGEKDTRTLRNGLVDLANGVIYRYHANEREQQVSLAWLGAGFIIATALIVIAANVEMGGIFAPGNLGALLVGWVAVLAGIVTHVGVASVKRQKAQGGLPPLIAVGDFLRVVDARLGQLLRKLLLALIGFFAYAFSVGNEVQEFTVLSAFLIGYSLDSFVELFGSSIEQQSTSQISAMKRQLGLVDDES